MLKYNIADYTPVANASVQLESAEMHHYSFFVTQAVKQGLGYESQGTSYLCHYTDQQLILQPLHPTLLTPTTAEPLPITYEAIETFKLVRAWNLSTFAKIVLKSFLPISRDQDLVFRVSLAPGRGKAGNRAEDFVTLGNGLLEAKLLSHHPEQVVSQFSFGNAADFRKQISECEVPVVVNFSAPGCKPCQMLDPIVHQTVEQYGDKTKLIKVNIEENFNIPMLYGIDCFPTILIFKAGQIVEQIVGTVPQASLAKVLDRHIE